MDRYLNSYHEQRSKELTQAVRSYEPCASAKEFSTQVIRIREQRHERELNARPAQYQVSVLT